MIRILLIAGLSIALIVLASIILVLGIELIRNHPINLTGYFLLVACAYLFVLCLKNLILKINEGRNSHQVNSR
jgi:hypothetical protein